MKTLRFTQSMNVYRRGDVAVFDDALADRIIRKGAAELVPDSAAASASLTDAGPENRKRRGARAEEQA